MKKLIFAIVSFLFIFSAASGSGIAIVDGSEGTCLTCTAVSVDVSVENQAAITVTTQDFINDLGFGEFVKYGFPLPEGVSAIQLRWKTGGGEWESAAISTVPQDTTLPGSGSGDDIDPTLENYLGDTPLYFEIPDGIRPDSTITIELTYVELLPYENGIVSYRYPNNYSVIQSGDIEQSFLYTLVSQRTINSISMESHAASDQSNDGETAEISYSRSDGVPDTDYEVEYSLDLDQLGLFSMSTFQPDSEVPDDFGNGYFLFVAEPDPSENTQVINKVFTLIIDRSGSMGGDKMVQARDAASFITENLNEGDKFNIVDFSSSVSSFRSEHVEYNNTNKQDALNYISGLGAGGSTNISGAFGEAIPQFSAANDSSANIIIFFTDGEATAGYTNTQDILDYINELTMQNESDVMIFTFGIGSSVNEQLLSLIAQQNNGLAEFLGSDELESSITDFYMKIRNPVLLNTQVSFSPDIINEVYPNPLPNLYKGQQMIIAGRYDNAEPVEVTFSGETFGNPVEYTYNVNLAESAVESNQFIPKIWAKKVIEYMTAYYHTLDPNSTEAEEYKNEISMVSVRYGVMSEFTSFTEDQTPVIEEISQSVKQDRTSIKLLNINRGRAVLQFNVGFDLHQDVKISIYNIRGQLVRTIILNVNGMGVYNAVWDGMLENGRMAPNDIYFCVVELGDKRLTTKLVYMR